jgi:hypothetical protein
VFPVRYELNCCMYLSVGLVFILESRHVSREVLTKIVYIFKINFYLYMYKLQV